MPNLRQRVADWITGAQPDGYGGYGGRGWTSWGYGYRGAETNSDPTQLRVVGGYPTNPRPGRRGVHRPAGGGLRRSPAGVGGRTLGAAAGHGRCPSWAQTRSGPAPTRCGPSSWPPSSTYCLGSAETGTRDGDQIRRGAPRQTGGLLLGGDQRVPGRQAPRSGPSVTGADLAAGNWAQGLAYSVGGRVLRPYDPDAMYPDSAAPNGGPHAPPGLAPPGWWARVPAYGDGARLATGPGGGGARRTAVYDRWYRQRGVH